VAGGTGTTFSFTPTDAGTYTLTLTATDKDTQSSNDSRTITVTAKAPTATITGAPASVVEGTPVSLGSTVTDGVDDDTPITYAWSVTAGNGQSLASGTSANYSFTPMENGTYTVSLTATDKDGQQGRDSEKMTVTTKA